MDVYDNRQTYTFLSDILANTVRDGVLEVFLKGRSVEIEYKIEDGEAKIDMTEFNKLVNADDVSLSRDEADELLYYLESCCE